MTGGRDGDLVAVMTVLGPDLPAAEWALRLGVSVDMVRTAAILAKVETADGRLPTRRHEGGPPRFAPFEAAQIRSQRAAGSTLRELSMRWEASRGAIRTALRAGEAA